MKTPLGEMKKTQRGFEVIEFEDRYDVKCSLQQSSLADFTRPGCSAIWLGIDGAEPKILAADAEHLGVETLEVDGWIPYPLPEDVYIATRMHLDLSQAKALVAVLEQWIKSGSFVDTDK